MKSSFSLAALLVGATIVTAALPASATPVAGNGLYNPRDYIEIAAAPVTFSKTEVAGDETLAATVKSSGVCITNSPAPTTSARYTYKYVAQHKLSGVKVVLNAGFRATIDPLPQKAGETFAIVNDVPLQFPAGSAAGDYAVSEETTFVEILVPGADWQEAPFVTKPAVSTTSTQTAGPQRIREIGTVKLSTASVVQPTVVEATKGDEAMTSDEDSSAVAVREVAEAIEVTTISVSPTSVTGGSASVGKVTLNRAAAAGGQEVVLMSSAASGVLAQAIPPSLKIKEGEKSGTFSIVTRGVSSTNSVYVRARLKTSGKVLTAILTVVPQLTVNSLSFSPSTVVAGTPSTGRVTLNRAAPVGGQIVQLSAAPASVLLLPSTVVVEAGKTTATFTVPTKAVPTTKYVTVKAATEKSFAVAQLVVAPLTISSLSLSPSSAIGGATATGKVVLNGPAPVGGQAVQLSAASHSALSLPSGVTVEVGKTTGTFTIQTRGLARVASLTVRASLNNSYRTASFTISPLTLSALSVSPSSAMGGATLAGRVSLSGPAPDGGQAVQLSAAPSNALSVPSSVTVEAGRTYGNFVVQTKGVTRSVNATIRATLNNSYRTINLTVLKTSGRTVGQAASPAAPAAPAATLASSGLKIDFLTCTLAGAGSGSRVRAMASGSAVGPVGARLELPLLIWSDDRWNCGDWSYRAGALIAVGGTCVRKEGQPETTSWSVDTGGEEQGDWLRGKTRSYGAKLYLNNNLTPEKSAQTSAVCQ